MSEYAQRFAENKIDIAVLRYLTDQDLQGNWRLARSSAQNVAAIARACGRGVGDA